MQNMRQRSTFIALDDGRNNLMVGCGKRFDQVVGVQGRA